MCVCKHSRDQTAVFASVCVYVLLQCTPRNVDRNADVASHIGSTVQKSLHVTQAIRYVYLFFRASVFMCSGSAGSVVALLADSGPRLHAPDASAAVELRSSCNIHALSIENI